MAGYAGDWLEASCRCLAPAESSGLAATRCAPWTGGGCSSNDRIRCDTDRDEETTNNWNDGCRHRFVPSGSRVIRRASNVDGQPDWRPSGHRRLSRDIHDSVSTRGRPLCNRASTSGPLSAQRSPRIPCSARDSAGLLFTMTKGSRSSSPATSRTTLASTCYDGLVSWALHCSSRRLFSAAAWSFAHGGWMLTTTWLR